MQKGLKHTEVTSAMTIIIPKLCFFPFSLRMFFFSYVLLACFRSHSDVGSYPSHTLLQDLRNRLEPYEGRYVLVRLAATFAGAGSYLQLSPVPKNFLGVA